MVDQDATKKRLLEAAGAEFAEKGFDGASVRGICERAGANLAAVNYHYGGKDALYEQAVIEAHRCGIELPQVEEMQGVTPAETLRLFIRGFLGHVFAVNRQASWHHGLMMRELVHPTSASETLVREVIRPRFTHLVALLHRICPEADEKRLHALAFSIVSQCMHYRVCRSISERLVGTEEYNSFDLDYLTDHIAGFTLAALGLGPAIGANGQPASACSIA